MSSVNWAFQLFYINLLCNYNVVMLASEYNILKIFKNVKIFMYVENNFAVIYIDV